jgi:hypothetical protein
MPPRKNNSKITPSTVGWIEEERRSQLLFCGGGGSASGDSNRETVMKNP